MGGGEEISASICKQLSSGRFEKICKLGGFLQAHVSNCPVADLRKSANWGGILSQDFKTTDLFLQQILYKRA